VVSDQSSDLSEELQNSFGTVGWTVWEFAGKRGLEFAAIRSLGELAHEDVKNVICGHSVGDKDGVACMHTSGHVSAVSTVIHDTILSIPRISCLDQFHSSTTFSTVATAF
jgi:hypothetical protein